VANVTTKTSPSISKFQGYVWFVVYGVVVEGGVHDGGRFVEHIQRGRSGKREQTGLTGNTTTITGLNILGDYTLPSRRRDTEQPERANPSS
jgi:hypothetical protein